MDDFIFGTLATEELRLRHIRALRSGISHAQRRSPRDPLPGQAVQLTLSLAPHIPRIRPGSTGRMTAAIPPGKTELPAMAMPARSSRSP